MDNASELIEKLNLADESSRIEAKRGSTIDRSILETICAYANEPGLGGGYIVLGVEREDTSLFPSYRAVGLENIDKLQLDVATQCATSFNLPIRPEIAVELVAGKNVMNVFVGELPDAQKPVYFKNEGLPRGAYRRIGSSDQRCTEDDLIIFYNNHNGSFDNSPVSGSSWEDVDEAALNLYRSLRANVNPYAEELSYGDEELLMALGCLHKGRSNVQLTYAGLLVFGNRQAQRRLLPAVRVDYIRVPGNEWISDPETRFTTVDMRGPLLSLVTRAHSAIADDLPRGFLLPDGEIQASSTGLPGRVLREAIVNSLMHRSYRVNQPIQIIRYGNRIEISNPGFSLKPEEQLGEPGSQQRNPYIAAIFHETNLAETKGSGIRTMRKLMELAGMVPPTFESDHSNNQFTARLLLHHLLNEEDLTWLSGFDTMDLNDSQKRALIFVREAGAIDNAAYRQLNAADIFKASLDLRQMRDLDLLQTKGKGRATYYIPSEELKTRLNVSNGNSLSDQLISLSDQSEPLSDQSEGTLTNISQSLSDQFNILAMELPEEIQTEVKTIGPRIKNKDILNDLICKICSIRAFSLKELSVLLQRKEKYLLEYFIAPLRESGRLQYKYPDMPNHPGQSYKTT